MSRACAVAIAGFMILFAPQRALAQELQWIGSESEDGASLSYAVPESDAGLIDFTCDRGTGIVTVTLEYEPTNAEEGVEVPVTLSALGGDPGQEIVIAGTGQRLDLDDKFIIQGTADLGEGLRSLLIDTDTMAITIEDGSEEIAMESARESAQKFIAICGRS